MLYLYLAFGIMADIFGIYVAKKFVDSGELKWILGIVFTSIVLNILYILVLTKGTVSILTAVWLIVVLLGGILIGSVLFKETITLLQWVGVILAIAAITCLQWPTNT